MRLHFSIGSYDYRRTARFRQSVHFSIIQVFFADHVAPTRWSVQQTLFPQVSKMMQGGTYFPETRRMLLFHAPLVLTHFSASFYAASRAFCSCHSVSSWDRSSNFGALGLPWWVSLGQITRAKDFCLQYQCDLQELSSISHVGLFSACLSSSVRLRSTSAAPCPERRNPIVVFSMECTQQFPDLTRDRSHGRQRVAPFYHETHTSVWL